MINANDCRHPIEALAEEVARRCRRGERLSVEQLAAAHPEHAETIRELAPTIIAMERLKRPQGSTSARRLNGRLAGLEQIAEYRILREIGRGGMGVVYEAHQESLGRRVALKVFPEHPHLSPRRLERFRREAETAARLHHTNIVPVFGVGEDHGLSYFVMQYIHGFGLDRVVREVLHLREQGDGARSESTTGGDFTPRDAAALLLWQPLAPAQGVQAAASTRGGDRTYWRNVAWIGAQAAEALHHAHSQGVVHRDVKPANLLLDADGAVWVTDFGLAKAADQADLSDTGDVVGTLRYMAPEQFRQGVDPAVDIYSLGVTLYDLLTVRAGGDDSADRSLARGLAAANPRAPRKLNANVPRDLETIVLKSIAQDPAKRYVSARALADDLHRFVEDRPILARRVGPAERAWRWSRRNPWTASLALLLLLVFSTGFVLTGWQWREAEAEKRRAEANLSLAIDSINEILDRFGAAWMEHPVEPEIDGARADVSHRFAVSDQSAQMLLDALRFYERFSQLNAADPRLRREIAQVHRRVGDIRARLGEAPQAEAAYREAIAHHRRLIEASPSDAALVCDLAGCLNALGDVVKVDGRFDEAQRAFREAQTLLDEYLSNYGESHAVRFELALTHINLRDNIWSRRRPGESYQSQQLAMYMLRQLHDSEPENPQYDLALARLHRSIYFGAAFGPRRSEVREDGIKAIELLEALVAAHPGVPDYQCELAETLTIVFPEGRADAYAEEQAEQQQRAVELARNLTEQYAGMPRYEACLAQALHAWAGTLRTQRQYDEAEPLLREAARLYQSLSSRFPEVRGYRHFLAWTSLTLGESLREAGRLNASKTALLKAVALQEKLDEGRRSRTSGFTAPYYRSLAETLERLGEHDEAAAVRELAAEGFPQRRYRRSSGGR